MSSRKREKCNLDWLEEKTCDVLAMLRDAMHDEKKAARAYRYLAEKAQCEADKEVIWAIRMDEKRHFQLLQSIYRELTCKCYTVDSVKVKRPKSLCKGLKKSICYEMEAASEYEKLAHCLCNMEHKEIVCAILNDEREHAQELAAVYRLACRNSNPCCPEELCPANPCRRY